MSLDPPKGNVKNPAIRRIHADIRELRCNPSDQYYAEPLEENLFEWHFTLRGPSGTDFDGGIYHGRILLPPEYPFKPPNIMLLTPNGRFEVGKKICLSISAHHPEHWQPAWGIRLILEALISFFPTDPKGAVGSLDWTPVERNRLARESVTWSCPRCGPLTSIIKAATAEGAGGAAAASSGESSGPSPYAKEISQLYVRSASGEPSANGGADVAAGSNGTMQANGPHEGGGAQEQQGPGDRTSGEAAGRRPINNPAVGAARGGATVSQQVRQQRRDKAEEADDDKLLYVAIALFVLIMALIARKINKMTVVP